MISKEKLKKTLHGDFKEFKRLFVDQKVTGINPEFFMDRDEVRRMKNLCQRLKKRKLVKEHIQGQRETMLFRSYRLSEFGKYILNTYHNYTRNVSIFERGIIIKKVK